MVKKITRWTADTCGCILEYEWDDDGNNDDDKVHTFHAAPHICGGHLAVEAKTERGKEKVYEAVKRENTDKNLAFKTIVEETSFGEEVIVRGDHVRRLKESLEFEYKFTGDDAEHRTLEFELKDARTKQKITIPKADLDKIRDRLLETKERIKIG